MNPIKFYNKYIISSYFISNFNISTTNNILKLDGIKIKLLFNNLNKINYVTSFLVFSILTQTKPIFIKGLKNYKENRIELIGLNLFINKKKYDFLQEMLINLLLENKDSIKRLKKQPFLMDTLILDKYLDSLYVDKVYELNNIVRNSQQIKLYFSFFSRITNRLQNTFLFNILINEKIIPKILI